MDSDSSVAINSMITCYRPQQTENGMLTLISELFIILFELEMDHL